MSFDAARNALKQLFESLTYTNKYNEAQPVNVYFETDLENAKSKFKTPAIVVRGVTSLTSPISIGWNEWRELGELTVSLYTKQRATDYNAESVMEEVTAQIEALAKQYKDGIGNAQYLKLTNIVQRDWIEKPGILRRDFVFELYKEE